MKTLRLGFSLLATVYASMLMAENGVQAYQEGNYALASKVLENKDPTSQFYMGKLRLYGYGLLKNTPLALQYFTEAASRGYLPAEQLMARYMLIAKNDPAQALVWFKKAASQGDNSARMYCAAAYLFGFGVPKNPDMARHYYIDAARDGDALAQFTLGHYFLDSKDKNSKKLGLIWLSKSAEKGHPAAQNKLGEIQAAGQLLPQNLDEAKALFTQAAQKGFVQAMINLGQIAQSKGDYTLAQDWFMKANNHPNPQAALALSRLFLTPNTPLYNPTEGYNWAVKAAENEKEPSSEAMLELARLYEQGIGVAVNPTVAQQWKDKAQATLSAPTPQQLLISWLTDNQATQFAATPYALKGIFTSWTNPNALKDNQYHASPDLPKIPQDQLFKPQFKMIHPNDIGIADYYQHLASQLSSKSSIENFPFYPIHPSLTRFMEHHSPVLRHDEMPQYIYPDAFYPTDETNGDIFTVLSLAPKDQDMRINFQNALLQLYNRAILGDANAQFELGQLYHAGIGVAKNIPQAITYYQLAATQQELKAEYNLGLLYLKGETTPVDYTKGIDWLMDAAFKGNPYAQYVLGQIYQHGLIGPTGKPLIEANIEQSAAMYSLASVSHFAPAEYQLADTLVKQRASNLNIQAQAYHQKLIKKLYQEAADQGVAEAHLPLAFYHAMSSDPKEQTAAFHTAKAEAETGNPHAALLVGLLYDRGIGTAQDTHEAKYWYERSTNNPITAFILGTYASESKDPERAKNLLGFAANQNLSFANYNLAILNHDNHAPFLALLIKAQQEGLPRAGLLLADYYLNTIQNPQNLNLVRNIYTSFAEKGDKDAALKLGYVYEHGVGIPANLALAEKWYLNAANQNQPIAQYLLGQFYQSGRNALTANIHEAKKWYIKAVENGYNNANIALGFLEDTVKENYEKAAEYYKKAFETQKNPLAQFNLALIKEYGKGEPVDYNAAFSLYLDAAEQGHVKSMTQLAGLYLNGLGTRQDSQEAYKWYEKAAKLGDRNAIYHLGELTLKGMGTTADVQKATAYFKQAMDLGQEQARAAYTQLTQTEVDKTKTAPQQPAGISQQPVPAVTNMESEKPKSVSAS